MVGAGVVGGGDCADDGGGDGGTRGHQLHGLRPHAERHFR